jgi:hypothetical protein
MGKRTSVLLAVITVAAASLAPPASADPVPSPIHVTSTPCAFEEGGLESGSKADGRASADIYASRYESSPACSEKAALDPANLAQQVWIYFRNPTTHEQGLCTYTEWYYNETKTSHFGIYVDPVAACGPGEYMTVAHGAVGVDKKWIWGNASTAWHYYEPATAG